MTATGQYAVPDQRAAAHEAHEDRGRLHIDQSVLRKIVEHAADQEPSCVRVGRSVAGLGAGDHGARARISGPERALSVRLDVALRYPVDIAEAAEHIRSRVRSELLRITGYRAENIEITVSRLVSAPSPPRAR